MDIDEALDILRDQNKVRKRQDWMRRLAQVFYGPIPDGPFFLNGYSAGFQFVQRDGRVIAVSDPLTGNVRGPCPDPYSQPEAWLDFALIDAAEHVWGLDDQTVFRPICVEFGPYGVHFVDALLGAEVFQDTAGAWHSHPVGWEVGDLPPPEIAHRKGWETARRIAEAFVQRGVTVPLLGMPTIASPLNIAVNIYGERILFAFYDRPQAARRDLEIIAELQVWLHRWYQRKVSREQLQPVIAAWRCQPPGHGQLCGCSTQLVSAAVYGEFIAPLDARLLSAHPRGGMIHLCGQHTHLIPIWREMKELRAVQLNDRAAEEMEAYVRGLRPDQVIYVNPCPGMPVEEIGRLARGRRVVVVADAPESVR